jgi:hypothetical protein
MDQLLKNIGLFAIFFAIVYGYKKMQEYYHMRQSGSYADENVYKAAEAFARGAPVKEVEDMLKGCFEFDQERAERVLSGAAQGGLNKDGGYRAFIRSVNNVLGEKAYDERRKRGDGGSIGGAL